MQSSPNNTIQTAQELVNLTQSADLSVSNPTLNFVLENIHHLVSHPSVLRSMRDFLLKTNFVDNIQTNSSFRFTVDAQGLQKKRNGDKSLAGSQVKVVALEINKDKNGTQANDASFPNEIQQAINRQQELVTYPATTRIPRKEITAASSLNRSTRYR